jgi:1-acyl-sn-glycerol-3-phosphate acyltransferase
MTPNATRLPVQFQGSRLAHKLLQWAGWTVQFEGFPTLQGVIVGYPHTSNWDFVLMVLVKWATGLQVKFLAKDSLFRYPLFSRWLRHLGGVPIDRSAAHGVVAELVHMMREEQAQQRYFWLALSPEGTRKRTEGWKSGFYQVAVQTGVPVCLLRIDYGQRRVDFRQIVQLSGDLANDYARIAAAYEGVQGFHVAQAAPIRPLTQPGSVSEGSAP